MATQAYYDWLAAGKPWHKAVPVAEYQAAFIKAGWPVSILGTIGDDAHLRADRPQDHTPFSVTGWPGPHPYPAVLAFDAGHRPERGFDMGPVVAQWLADARDGKTPWVKYIVWRGQSFDVRRDFEPAGASGHYDHAHVSFRTDWHDKSIGGYPVVGKVDFVGTTQTGRDVWNETINAGSEEYSQPAGEYLKWEITNARALQRIEPAVEALSAAVAALSAGGEVTVDPQALADALAANQGFVDVLATTIAARLGMIPTAGEIAKAVGNLTWHGRPE